MDRHRTEQVDISYFSEPVLMNWRTELGGGTDGETAVQVVGCKQIVGQLEVSPPHYTLQPAGQTGVGLNPGRRSPGGDGGVMGLESLYLIRH